MNVSGKCRPDKEARIAIVGGGASGLFAAVCAARQAELSGLPAEISVYEALSRIGKKLLSTGNGRCNLTNTSVRESDYFGDPELLRNVLGSFSVQDTLSAFRTLCLYTKADAAGRIYPSSNQASSVLDALRFACSGLGVRIFTEYRVTSLQKHGHGFLLNARDRADAVIYACGSPAGNAEGGASIALLKDLGVDTVPFAPALCPLKLLRYPAALKGVRANGEVRLYCGERLIASDTGEIQYTDYGVSGIPVMQVSAAAAPKFRGTERIRLFIDSMPDTSAAELFEIVARQRKISPELPVSVLYGGLLPKKLGEAFLRACAIRADLPIRTLTDEQLRHVNRLVKEMIYTVERPLGMGHAQVAAGGVSAAELEPGSLALRRAPRIYVCGEAVDVHGLCGGYNLQWAWSSAYCAVTHAVEDLLRDQS